jgi:hypothetical protein
LPFRETRIKGNLILLGRAPELQTFTPSPTYAALLTRYTLSLSLARSSALSAVEAKLDDHLESVSKVPHMLEVWGKQPLGRKEVIRKIGELMVLREAVNFRGGGLEDTPEVSILCDDREFGGAYGTIHRYTGRNHNSKVRSCTDVTLGLALTFVVLSQNTLMRFRGNSR